jgi:uncharacterized protein (TIGR00661 family)
MRFAFIIQGEGRGHQTQAISLAEILQANGHELVGTVKPEHIPVLLKEKATFEIAMFQSPSLVFNPKTQALSIPKTIQKAVPHLKKYIKSVHFIKNTLAYYKPDVIINFYDVLGGIYAALYKSNTRIICIGHQYLLRNPLFSHPKGLWWDRQIVNLNTAITAMRSDKKLALSFSAFPNHKNTISVPPLLRNELKLYNSESKNHILVYLTQPDLIESFLKQAVCFPDETFEVFIDKKINNIPKNVLINSISTSTFLQKMSTCKGIISTAGFEAVCEAMHMGKPVLMVPIKNHYEQHCNALDAQRVSVGLFSQNIDIQLFLDYLKTFKPLNQTRWISLAEQIFLEELGLKVSQSKPVLV